MPTADTRRRILRRLKKVQLDPTPDVLEGLIVYYDLLRRWNEKINLTASTDGDDGIDRLLVEPLLAARALPETTGTLVDIGSGGGSPAIPLKLAAPSVSLWMIESKARKSAFLREVTRQLQLDDAIVETGRFEEVMREHDLSGAVDVLSMRAVRADIKTLASVQHVLRPGGELFFFTKLGTSARLLLPPQLELLAEELLVPSLQSSLIRLRKKDLLTERLKGKPSSSSSTV